MQFRPIQLQDRDLILSFQPISEIPLSDFNFTNLWIWRFAREICLCIAEGCLIIRTTYPSQEPYYFFPLGPHPLAALAFLLEREPNARFKSLTQEQAELLRRDFGLEAEANRDRFDYVYSIPELIALSGRKYHKKKNHLNKFLQTYPHFVFESIDASDASSLDELAQTYESWFVGAQGDESLYYEKRGIDSILQDFHTLSLPDSRGLFGLKGGLIRIDGKIAAFSFAEAISEQSVVVHIEKADTAFAGIFQAINQQCLSQIWGEYLWANREEDLGIEGLRKAKLSYQPAALLEKYEL